MLAALAGVARAIRGGRRSRSARDRRDCNGRNCRASPGSRRWATAPATTSAADARTRDRFALMVGTSGAMRAVVEAGSDRNSRRPVLLSRGSETVRARRRAFERRRGLRLDEADPASARQQRSDRKATRRAAARRSTASRSCRCSPVSAPPDGAPTRAPPSPDWASNTSPIEILQAALESVALRFRNVYEIMKSSLGAPREIVASGSALLHSRVWTQMMADALVASHRSVR